MLNSDTPLNKLDLLAEVSMIVQFNGPIIIKIQKTDQTCFAFDITSLIVTTN